MRKRAARSFVELGGLSSYLQWASTAGTQLHGQGYILDCIERFVRLLGVHGFVVTGRACRELTEIRKKLASSKPDARLTAEQAKELSDFLRQIQTCLFAEAEGHIFYVATDKRYAADKLADDVWTLFGANVKERLPEIALLDIEEAGKCVLFERSTAAGFHLMRATEATLKAYYEAKAGGSSAGKMWAAMVSALRALPGHDVDTLDHLDNIRRNFRNPTQHPEKVYDIQEVQDLFGVCVDVINRMSKALPQR